MRRSIEFLYLLIINVIAPQLLKTLAFLIPAMHARFWALVVFFVVLQCMNIFRNDAKQNSVMANDLWSLDCPKHHRLYAPYAFERLFNANSCSGNYQINTDVTGIVPNIKKPSSTAGFF